MARQRVVQPRTGESPLPFDRSGRNVQQLADFVRREAAEEFQLDDAALARIESRQTLERVVKRDHIDIGPGENVHGDAERDALLEAAALGGDPIARVIDEDAPHHHCRESDELRAVPPVHALLVDEPEVRLVHQCSWLKRVVGALPVHVAGSKASQLIIDERQHLLTRSLAASAYVEQQLSDRS